MGDYGFRISVAGQDVKSCNDLDTIINSKYANLKGQTSGTGSTTVSDDTTNTITIAHGLGYIPFIQAYHDLDGSNADWNLMPNYGGISVSEDYQIWCYSDVTNVYLLFYYYDGASGSYTFHYKYYIYTDKGKL